MDNETQLAQCVEEIKSHLKECNLLAVDLEYHNFAKVISHLIIVLAHISSRSATDFNLSQGFRDRCLQSESTYHRGNERHIQ